MIEEIQIIDLIEIIDIKELHEKFAAMLKFPKSYGHNWKAFWSAITVTERLP